MEPFRSQREGDSVVFLIDGTMYSLGAVHRAAHWYTDRAFVVVGHAGNNVFSVRMTPKVPALRLDEIIGEFGNSLLDAQLRLEIANETARIRELIVAKAFAEGDLLDDQPTGDWRDPVDVKKSP